MRLRKTGRDPIGIPMAVLLHLEEVGPIPPNFCDNSWKFKLCLNLRMFHLFEKEVFHGCQFVQFFWLQHVQQTFQGCFSSMFLLHKPNQAGYYSGWRFQPI